MRYKLKCMKCDYLFKEDQFYNECPKCGGLIEAIIENISTAVPDNNYETIMRYHKYLPIENFKTLEKFESAKPTSIVLADEIAKKYGFKKLLFKDETTMETGTMKDREGLLTINRLIINNIEGLVLASSGNAGISIAWYASKIKGPKIFLFLPECSRQRMEESIKKFTTKDIVKVIYVDGSTDEADEQAQKFAKDKQLPYGTGFKNYSRREGIKTFALEYLFEQNERADWYVQGVAGALAIYAFYKAHKELGLNCPKIAGVQPASCSPFVDAFHDGAEELIDKYIPPEPVVVPEAPVLKSRKPIDAYPVINKIMNEVDGYFEKVNAEEIKDALNVFYLEKYFRDKYKNTGILIGLEAATALAGIIKMRENNIIDKNETVLLNASGEAKPGDIPKGWLKEEITTAIYQEKIKK